MRTGTGTGTGTQHFRFPRHLWFQGLGRASYLEVPAWVGEPRRGAREEGAGWASLCGSCFHPAASPFSLALSFANQQTFQEMFCSHVTGEREASHCLRGQLLLSFSV